MHESARSERSPHVVLLVLVAGAIFGTALFTPAGLWLPVTWIAVGGSLIVLWISRVADPDDRLLLVGGALIGLTLRCAGAWLVVDYVYRYPDMILYWDLGNRVAEALSNPGILDVDLVKVVGTSSYGYYLWTGLHVLLLRDQILTSLSNALVGTASGVLAYLLARRVWNGRVGVIGAWLVWLSSAHIIVDAHSLRDSIATFSILAIVYGTQVLAGGWNWKGSSWLVLGFVSLVYIRLYIAAPVVLAIMIAFPLMARGRRLAILTVFVALAVVAGFLAAASDFALLAKKLGSGNTIATMLLLANKGLFPRRFAASAVADVEIGSFQDMVLHVPVGIVRILFAPLPWLPEKTDTGFIPDAVARYAMMPLFFVGFWDAVRYRWRRALLVALVYLAGVHLYALIELGGSVRHNIQFFPYYYSFAAAGWTVARRYGQALWFGYALVSLAVWIYGLTLWTAFSIMPVMLLSIAVWFFAYWAFARRGLREGSRA